ncbi:MAG: RNA pseudouridine synthase [Phycisphaerales bacterium]
MTVAPSILLEAPTWLVVDKPAGWHTVLGATAASSDGSGVIEAWIARSRPELVDLPEHGLVHRLDRDTSGCLVVARTALAHADLARRFRDGVGVRKWYLARVAPGIAADGAATFFYTSRHKGSARVTVAAAGDPKHVGRFRWRVVERDDRRGDVVELELVGPGKRHQLRAGCARLGHPLVGDALYGGAAGDAMCLHAARVEIDGVVAEAPRPAWASPDDNGSRA